MDVKLILPSCASADSGFEAMMAAPRSRRRNLWPILGPKLGPLCHTNIRRQILEQIKSQMQILLTLDTVKQTIYGTHEILLTLVIH